MTGSLGFMLLHASIADLCEYRARIYSSKCIHSRIAAAVGSRREVIFCVVLHSGGVSFWSTNEIFLALDTREGRHTSTSSSASRLSKKIRGCPRSLLRRMAYKSNDSDQQTTCYNQVLCTIFRR